MQFNELLAISANLSTSAFGLGLLAPALRHQSFASF